MERTQAAVAAQGRAADPMDVLARAWRVVARELACWTCARTTARARVVSRDWRMLSSAAILQYDHLPVWRIYSTVTGTPLPESPSYTIIQSICSITGVVHTIELCTICGTAALLEARLGRPRCFLREFFFRRDGFLLFAYVDQGHPRGHELYSIWCAFGQAIRGEWHKVDQTGFAGLRRGFLLPGMTCPARFPKRQAVHPEAQSVTGHGWTFRNKFLSDCFVTTITIVNDGRGSTRTCYAECPSI